MSHIRNILVCIQDASDIGPALDKVARLERYSGATVTVMRTIYDWLDQPSRHIEATVVAKAKERYIQGARDDLEKLAAPFLKSCADVEYRIEWNPVRWRAELEAAADVKADLIVAHVPHDSTMERLIHAPDDWHLIRHSPVPLFLVHSRPWHDEAPVLTAIDVGDEGHDRLNRELLTQAGQLASMVFSKLHVVTCYPGVSEWMNSFLAASETRWDAQSQETETAEAYGKSLDAAVEAAGLENPPTLHVERGSAHERIPALATDVGAHILVLGGASRRHLSEAFLGGTAERILHHTTQDVFVLPALEG